MERPQYLLISILWIGIFLQAGDGMLSV
uniref:Uncharacterized protein n=1 Tax=Rhodnius prolixus TaxID=13249 RepID=T1IBJ8_RHOPR